MLSYTERIHEWLKICECSHEKCRTNSAHQASNPARPARLLDVQVDDRHKDVRLIPFEDAAGPYAALSYSWGDRPHATTTTSLNIEERMRSIPLETLPKTFTDAIAFCREMGVRYLWIDALCIVQPRKGDELGHQDWEAQSGIMGYIYANAIYTIAAQGASNADIGLFPPKTPFDLQPRSCPLFTQRDAPSIYIKAEPPDWVASVGESVLQQRAWVLQERLMSTRLIHFTQHTVFWECAELCASEFEPDQTETGGLLTLSVIFPPNEYEGNLAGKKESVMMEWMGILADYTERNLSVITDKFPAISAIAKRVATLTGDAYIAGVWKSRLFDGLLWTGMWKFPSYRRRPYTYPQRTFASGTGTYIAPSWSWASVIGKTSHDYVPKAYRRVARVKSISVELANTDNPFGHVKPGGSLQLTGRIRHNIWAKERETDDDDAPYHDLWFMLPEGHPLAEKGEESLTRHTGVASVWFDVASDYNDGPFSAVMMTQTELRNGLDNNTVAPDPGPHRTSGLALLIVRLDDDEGRYIRIGQANMQDINFFVGCEEETVTIV